MKCSFYIGSYLLLSLSERQGVWGKSRKREKWCPGCSQGFEVLLGFSEPGVAVSCFSELDWTTMAILQVSGMAREQTPRVSQAEGTDWSGNCLERGQKMDLDEQARNACMWSITQKGYEFQADKTLY